MPNEDLLKVLFGTKLELEKTLNLTKDEIQKEALEYFKKNKKRIFETFIENKKDTKRVRFSAGASGAGKSEFVKTLNEHTKLNVIDTDEIRKLFPYYSGANAELFQRASIKTVEYLLDNCFKYNYAFILDTNLASFEVADKNIQRALERDYQIEIFFIYRNYEDCKRLTIIREKNENRKVPDSVFNQKAIGSLDTFKKLVDKYGFMPNMYLLIIDLEKNEILTNDNQPELINRLELYSQELKIYLNSNKEF